MIKNTDPTPPPFLVADHVALDFLNSVASPWGHEIEWLGSGRQLQEWLKLSGLLTPAAEKVANATSDPDLNTVAETARDLREWLRGFVIEHAGQPLTDEALPALAALNQQLKADRLAPRLVSGDDGTLRTVYERDCQTADDLLRPLYTAIADLLTTADFSRIRNCEGPACTLWFLDTTRNNKRRWCTMSVCGNRAKASAFRARKRKDQTDSPTGA